MAMIRAITHDGHKMLTVLEAIYGDEEAVTDARRMRGASEVIIALGLRGAMLSSLSHR